MSQILGHDQELELYSLNLASSCLSLFGSAAIIINFIFFANREQALYKLIFFLSVTDFGGSLAIAVSQIALFLHHFDDVGYGISMCKVFRACINFFFVSSFFWTSAIALHIWVSCKQKAQIPMYWFHIVCWGIPGIATIILIATGMIEFDNHNDWCSNTTKGHWLFWYAPLFASFVWNAIAYALIIRHYREAAGVKTSGAAQKMKKKIKVRITLYLFVFFICWIWNFINFIINQFHVNSPFWMELLTVTFMPLQGFLNFLVYGVSSRMFRRRQGKKTVSRGGHSINYGGAERRGLLSDM